MMKRSIEKKPATRVLRTLSHEQLGAVAGGIIIYGSESGIIGIRNDGSESGIMFWGAECVLAR